MQINRLHPRAYKGQMCVRDCGTVERSGLDGTVEEMA